MIKPTKEEIRKWQEKNRTDHRAPVSPEQARKELGWSLLEEERREKEKLNKTKI